MVPSEGKVFSKEDNLNKEKQDSMESFEEKQEKTFQAWLNY